MSVPLFYSQASSQQERQVPTGKFLLTDDRNFGGRNLETHEAVVGI